MTDGRGKTKQMHSEERSWKPLIIGRDYGAQDQPKENDELRYAGRIQPNSKVKEVRKWL